ncbi:MAG: DUF1559 domain-containing protein [Planctomycetales bacterium]|nr:DUF1559 domain-containing protein [Planctomycetales bacterium]
MTAKHSLLKTWWACGSLCFAALWSTMAAGQESEAAVTARHVPNETVAMISAWPRQLAAKERMQLAPLEVLTAAGQEHIGLDPLQIERLDIMVGFPGPAGPQFGALLQLAVDFDIGNLHPRLLGGEGPQRDGNFEFLPLADSFPNMVVHQVDPRTVLFGTHIFAKQMVAERASPGQIAGIAAKLTMQQDVLALVSISTLRPLLLGLMDGFNRELPPLIAEDLRTVVQSTDFAALRLLIDESEKLQLMLSGTDEASAQAMEQSFQRSLQFAQQSIVQELKSQITDGSQTSAALQQYIDRLSGSIVELITPQRSGKRLVLELEEFQNIGVISTLTGLLLPAVQAARTAARRAHSSNNLKQIGLAMHNFHDAYSAFPAAAGVDDDGRPLLSWRVAILPFIEQQQLYDKFHMDEPWDSEHNIQLLQEMPTTFLHPDRKTQPGHTVYQAVISDHSLLRRTEPTSLRDITDGTSNTIMVLETTPDAAVPWTAPEDYEVDEDNPGAQLFLRGITQAVFGDGSVHVLSESVEPSLLRALYTRAGGERVNF